MITTEDLKQNLPNGNEELIKSNRKEVAEVLSWRDERVLLITDLQLHNKALTGVLPLFEFPLSKINVNEEGIWSARREMVQLAKIVPIVIRMGTSEAIFPYFADLASMVLLDNPSQAQLLLANSLDIPVGIAGRDIPTLKADINIVCSPQLFFGVNDQGEVSPITSLGNPIVVPVLQTTMAAEVLKAIIALGPVIIDCASLSNVVELGIRETVEQILGDRDVMGFLAIGVSMNAVVRTDKQICREECGD